MSRLFVFLILASSSKKKRDKIRPVGQTLTQLVYAAVTI